MNEVHLSFTFFVVLSDSCGFGTADFSLVEAYRVNISYNNTIYCKHQSSAAVLQYLIAYTLFFVRTSKFWPSLIVLNFLGNFSLNCS